MLKILRKIFHPEPKPEIIQVVEEYKRTAEAANKAAKETSSVANDVRVNVASALAFVERTWENKK